MTWILFILIFRGVQGIAVDHIELTSRTACMEASQAIQQGLELKEYTTVTMSCVQKD